MATTVLEGHRLAVVDIPKGERLLSWGLPFGVARKDIVPGEYVCNAPALATLHLKHIEGLPEHPNFEDLILPHTIDEATFCPMPQVPLLPEGSRRTFMGFDRSDAQGGVGTRNFVAIVPTSALSGPYARRLAEAMRASAKPLRICDGVVALPHTEAAVEADGAKPRNWDLLLRTLAGWVCHPNVAAALVVGYGGEMLTPEVLRDHMKSAGYAFPKWFEFLTLGGHSFEEDLIAGREAVLPWLAEVDRCQRTEQPVSQLRVALQCGGSDAFSGVSGNPAAGTAAKLLIENGGSAVLAETDELIGAESYILSRVKDLATAQKFLHMVARFKERFWWHGGQSAESNPSDGNKLRGLYNIALKSLGAAKKKHAEVALDGVLEYSERLPLGERGYYFLDSPGNDLESIAGQVASGCNVIFFITGNGSITNFPFVPTQKIITTTDRYKLLEHDMDFNAGRFQDEGIAMAALGNELFEDMLRVCSGEHSIGENAGHSQVSIWREWALDGPVADPASLALGELEGSPLARSTNGNEKAAAEAAIVRAAEFDAAGTCGTERLGLIMPTSLCSGEIARKVADELNECREAGEEDGAAAMAAAVDRFVALPHTEGCGIGYASDGERLFSRVMLGHLLHKNVALALMLEHGCEKTHNAWMTEELHKQGIDERRFGTASVQLDGGITKSTAKMRKWFAEQAEHLVASAPEGTPAVASRRSQVAPLSQLPIALLGEASKGGAASLAASLTRAFLGAGGTVLVPSNSPMLQAAEVITELCASRGKVTPSLSFAQPHKEAGVHVMQIPAGVKSRIEVITGLVAAGAGLVVIVTDGGPGKTIPVVGHPMVPTLHVSTDGVKLESEQATAGASLPDLVLGQRLGEDARARELRWLQATVSLIVEAASRRLRPKSAEVVSFQVARGPTGVSA